jgi:hypothetical protein
MCGPTAILAYYVSRLLTRSSRSRWPAIIQAALVPLSIGLMGASGLILALTADRTWAGGVGLCHAAQSALAVAGRGLLGFCWRYLTKIARQCPRHQPFPNREWARSPAPGREIDE